VVIDLVLKTRIAADICTLLSLQNDRSPFGMISRVHTNSTRDWPKATWLS